MANDDLKRQKEVPMEPVYYSFVKHQKEVPMEPVFFSFMLDAIVDKKRRKCMRAAVTRYRKSCNKAYTQLKRDLKRCHKKRK